MTIAITLDLPRLPPPPPPAAVVVAALVAACVAVVGVGVAGAVTPPESGLFELAAATALPAPSNRLN